jgi:hypothetical protein
VTSPAVEAWIIVIAEDDAVLDEGLLTANQYENDCELRDGRPNQGRTELFPVWFAFLVEENSR